MLQDHKTSCLQARPCIFQTENCKGWGSEGVKEFLPKVPADFMSIFEDAYFRSFVTIDSRVCYIH